MKSKILLLTGAVFLSAFAMSQSNYPGNGNTGFGGVLGTGNLQVTDDGTTVTCVLTKGSSNLNDAVVFYINSVTGGFTSTAGFTDNSDPLRIAISGYNGTNRTTANFAAGFDADYAIAFDQGFGGLWQLVNGGSHNYVTSVNLTPTGTNTSPAYTFSFNKSSIGLSGSVLFSFVATYISTTAWRSDEAIGSGVSAGNPGNSNPITFSDYRSYPAIVTPVAFTNFTAEKKNSSILLNWSIEQTGEPASFIVERSANGQSFTAIGEVKGNDGIYNYSFTDNAPLSKINFYRIKAVETGTPVKYSVIRSIKTDAAANPVIIVSNPVRDILRFNTAELNKGTWNAAIINAAGQRLGTYTFEGGNTQTQQITLPASAKTGYYYLQVSNGTETYIRKFIVE